MSERKSTSVFVVSTANSSNDTIEQEKIPLNIFVPVLVIKILGCIGVVVINAIVIAVMVRKKDLFQQCRSLIMSLAIVDMLVGAVTGPMNIPWNQTYPRNSQILENKLTFYIPVVFTAVFSQLSILHLAALSVDRLHATFYPIKHRFMSKRVNHVVILILWVTDILGNAIIIFVQEKAMEDEVLTLGAARKRYFIVSCLFCLLCLIVVGVSYFLIFMKIRFGESVNQRSGDRDRRLTTTLFLVTFLSFLTWLPLLIVFLARTPGSSSETNLLISSALRFLMGLNPLVNPLLYIFRGKEFKNEVHRLLQAMFCQKPTLNREVKLERLNTSSDAWTLTLGISMK